MAVLTTIAAARSELAAALSAGGVAVTDPRGQLVVPGALIRPGDPYLEPSRVGGHVRTLRLSALLLAGAADQLGALADLEELVTLAVPIVDGLAGWSSSRTSRARSITVAGATYLSAELILETLLQLEG